MKVFSLVAEKKRTGVYINRRGYRILLRGGTKTGREAPAKIFPPPERFRGGNNTSGGGKEMKQGGDRRQRKEKSSNISKERYFR